MSNFRDVVVLLPGITGSVLANRKGKEIWSPSARAIWRAITSLGGSIESLELADDQVDDGVTAPRLIPDVSIVPGLIKIDGYSRISQYLVDELGLTRGGNFHEFPYDWRRDNSVIAQRLQSQAMDWLNAWRASQGAADARLVLIGHSMGGLISRYFLECLGGWQHTRALITLGTPHRGSLNAIDFLVHGMKKGIGPLGLDLTPLLRSFTSVYQLLPIYPCIDVGAGDDARVAQAAADGLLPHVDASRALAARAFHTQIEEQQARNAQEARYREEGYAMVPLVGIEQPTYQSARAVGGVVELLRSWQGSDTGGDGTVPRGSATPLELDNGEREIYCAEMHGSLQNDGGTLANLKGILTRSQVDFKRMRSSAIAAALSMSLDDVVLPGEALTVRVKPLERNPKVSVRLEPLGGGEAIEDTLERGDDGWQVGEFALDPGAWRVTATADGASAVNELVVVAAP
jgi:pimeloyl-ACP methyl ester carboxylesterase